MFLALQTRFARRFEQCLCFIIQRQLIGTRLAHSGVKLRSKMSMLGLNPDKCRTVASATVAPKNEGNQEVAQKRNLSTFPRSGSSSPFPRSPESRLPRLYNDAEIWAISVEGVCRRVRFELETRTTIVSGLEGRTTSRLGRDGWERRVCRRL